jgi:thioredoxin 1
VTQQEHPALPSGSDGAGKEAKMAGEGVITATVDNFRTEVTGQDGLVLVDFWAPWCAPCRLVGPIVEELAVDNAGKMKVAKVNVDEQPTLAQQYGIRGIPTLLFFKGGQQVDMIVGAASKQSLQERINKHLM